MTDGNTYAINKHLDELEDYEALQEVTTELEQAEARIEELEAELEKAVEALEGLIELHSLSTNEINPKSVLEFARTTLAVLKGETDE